MKKRRVGLVERLLLLALMIAAILLMTAADDNNEGGCAHLAEPAPPSPPPTEEEQQYLKEAAERLEAERARQRAYDKLVKMEMEYCENYEDWTPEKLERARIDIVRHAQMTGIDFDPEFLPTKPPEGGVSGGSGGGSSGY